MTPKNENIKALVLENYGSPFVIKDIDRPKPGDGEALVQIKVSSINPLDTKNKNWQRRACENQVASDFRYR